MNLSNGIPDFDGTQKATFEAEPAEQSADKKAAPQSADSAAGQQGDSEAHDAASEADVPLDGRDLEGEAMIRDLPMNPDLIDAPVPSQPA